jgi:hypothetical protein
MTLGRQVSLITRAANNSIGAGFAEADKLNN